MVNEADCGALRERLIVWRGPLPFDLALEPERLANMALEHLVGTVVIDSLKDVARDLSKDETGGRVNLAFQKVVASGVELLVDHHQRKEGSDSRKPTRLSDVYGSTWITSGAGSVILLWGDAGDSVVDLHHLKQPAEEVGPLKVHHDHDRGLPTIYEGVDFYELVQLRAGNGGLAASDAARALYGVAQVTPTLREKARRRLDRMVKDGRIGSVPGDATTPTRYVPLRRGA